MRIAVCTCDSYNWIVPYFWHFFCKTGLQKHYEVDFVTETQNIIFGNTFLAGKLSWTDRIINYLNKIKDKRVLITLEENILWNADIERLKHAETLCKDDIGIVGLQPYGYMKKHLFYDGIEGYKTYPLNAPSAGGIPAAIWQKELFLKIYDRGLTVWQSEHKSSLNIQKQDKKVITSDYPIFDYIEGGLMRKGIRQEAIFKMMADKW